MPSPKEFAKEFAEIPGLRSAERHDIEAGMIRRSSGLVLFWLAGVWAAQAGTFPLRYTTEGATSTFPLPLEKSEVIFKAEPKYAGAEVVRSLLYLSGDKKDFIAFACDMESRTLYVDLNRNLDLTDDPDGVFQSATDRWSREFKNIRIPVEQGDRRRELLVDILIYRSNYGRYTVKSSWESDAVPIGDRTYRMAVVDDGDGVVNRRDALFLTPVTEGGGDAAAAQVELKAPASLVLDGQAWRFSYELAADGQTLALSVEPSSPRLQEVELTGENVERLVLESDKTAAVYFRPDQSISLPPESYTAEVWVRMTDGERSSLWHARRVSFRLSEKNESVSWRVGGPIVSTLSHALSGSQLSFNQATRGADGASYSLDSSSGVKFGKPKLRVKKAGKVIHVGEFEYG